jgi:hypothetical protein
MVVEGLVLERIWAHSSVEGILRNRSCVMNITHGQGVTVAPEIAVGRDLAHGKPPVGTALFAGNPAKETAHEKLSRSEPRHERT